MKNKILTFTLTIVLIGSLVGILGYPVSAETNNVLSIDNASSFENIRYVQDGNVVVNDRLEMVNTTLEILQDTDNQYSFTIETGGHVIMRNSIISSISTEKSASTPNLILYLKDDAYLEIINSSIGTGVSVVCGDSSILRGSNSFLYSSLVLNDNSRANLTNTVCGSIMAFDSGKAEIYRHLNINTQDSAGIPISNTEIKIKPTLSPDVIYISSTAGNDGTAKIPVLTDVIDAGTYPGSQFVGNYNVTVRYDGYLSYKYVTFPHYQTYSSSEIRNVVNTVTVDVLFPNVLIPPSMYFYSKGEDITVDGGKTITTGEGTWAISGNIHIKDNGTLIIKNTEMEVLQNGDGRHARYYIMVEDNGVLNIEGSSVSSNYPLNLYLYDNAVLNVAYSDLKLNLIGARDFSNIILHHSNIFSSFNCIMKTTNITQTNLKISDSKIESNKLFIQSQKYEIINVSFNQVLTIEGPSGENSRAELTNVTVPSIVVRRGAIAETYWWLTVTTVDLDNRSVSGCKVVISHYNETFECDETKQDYTNGYYGGKGTVTFRARSHLITSTSDVFLGNYRVAAYYQNNETFKSNEVVVAMSNNKCVKLAFTELIGPNTITADADLNPPSVARGDEVVVTGHATLNHAGVVANGDVKVTILETNKTWYTTTDADGNYRVVITAPNQKGKYTIEVYVTTDHISGSTTKTVVVDGVEEEGMGKFFASTYLPWSILGLILIWVVLYVVMKRRYTMEAETPHPF